MAAARYPWEEWADGEVHGLKHTGEDAEEDVKRFRNTLYMWAKRNEQNVRTRLSPVEGGEDGEIMIRFQMLPRDSEEEFSDIFRDGLDGFEPVELTPEGEIAV